MADSKCSELRKAARACAEFGFPVFPLIPGKKISLPGGHGHKDATTDLTKIDKAWTEIPNANIGIRTGDESGLVVLDVDVKNSAPGLQTPRTPFLTRCAFNSISPRRSRILAYRICRAARMISSNPHAVCVCALPRKDMHTNTNSSKKTGHPMIKPEYLLDCESLPATKLRSKYKAKSNSHRAMLSR
jgi:hypothetical protein